MPLTKFPTSNVSTSTCGVDSDNAVVIQKFEIIVNAVAQALLNIYCCTLSPLSMVW